MFVVFLTKTMRNGVHFCVITFIFHSFVFSAYFDTLLNNLDAKLTPFFQANSAFPESCFCFTYK